MKSAMSAPADSPVARNKSFDFFSFAEKYGVALVLAVLVIFFAIMQPRFLSLRNITNILTEVSIYGIMAVGMTFVILTAGVDLAVGSLLAFSAMCGALLVRKLGGDFALAWLVGLGVSCGVGALAGLLHGWGITRLNVPPFIVTLGGLTAWRGMTLILGDGGPVGIFDHGYLWWGRGYLLGIPVPVWLLIAVALAGHVVARYTRYGRQVYAVGGNAEAARLSGVDVKKILVSVYVLMGLLSGLSGFLISARLGSAEAVAGLSYELRVIAAVVIGGTSLFGGAGSVGGTVVGSLLLGVLLNGLVMLDVSAYYQQVVIGVIIVFAVAFDTHAKRRRNGI
jgi:inositol transport system permease protein